MMETIPRIDVVCLVDVSHFLTLLSNVRVGKNIVPSLLYPRRMQNADSLSKPIAPSRSSADATPARVPFEDLYLRLAPLLRRVAIRRFRVPSADADALVHDVFATYFTNADEVNAVEPYLVGAICNASRHYWRRAEAADALFCGETPCTAMPGSWDVSELERRMLLSRLLAQVGGRCRDLLQRYYLQGEATSVIAVAMHFKPATILTLLHQCRKRALSAYQSLSRRAS